MDFRSKLALVSPMGLGARPAATAPVIEAEPARPFLPARETQHGPVRLSERRHAPDLVHGHVPLAKARTTAGSVLAHLALDPALAYVDPSRLLLVDTETTGLSGGVGTLPFLTGLGWFDGDSLVTRQLFLGAPGEEAPLLRLFAEHLSQASVMVTFNGKSFDWPLLRTRFIMNRLRAPALPPHLDLLHCARRVFKRRLGSTRLQELEARVLDFHRVGDIDGALIPAVYFDWLRRGTTAMMQRVLEHNTLDLVSMAALLAELARRVAGVQVDDPAEDCLGLAELSLRAGDAGRAEELALLAACRATAPRTAFDGWALAAKLAGRRREWHEVKLRLDAALGLQGLSEEQAAGAHLALARVCEHRLKDRVRALHHARLAGSSEAEQAHARRIARLASLRQS